MGISRIGSLFAANVDSLSNRSRSSAQQEQSSTSNAATTVRGDEAVVFSSSLSSQSATPPASETRVDRVQQLKQQVASGNYRVDSEKVAVSVLRDLA